MEYIFPIEGKVSLPRMQRIDNSSRGASANAVPLLRPKADDFSSRGAMPPRRPQSRRAKRFQRAYCQSESLVI
jgi:hypothetical protein